MVTGTVSFAEEIRVEVNILVHYHFVSDSATHFCMAVLCPLTRQARCLRKPVSASFYTDRPQRRCVHVRNFREE